MNSAPEEYPDFLIEDSIFGFILEENKNDIVVKKGIEKVIEEIEEATICMQ